MISLIEYMTGIVSLITAFFFAHKQMTDYTVVFSSAFIVFAIFSKLDRMAKK